MQLRDAAWLRLRQAFPNTSDSLLACPCRYADTCSAVVVATAHGMVQTLVVAGEVIPTWARQSPACITQGRHLVAVRSEVLHIYRLHVTTVSLPGKHRNYEQLMSQSMPLADNQLASAPPSPAKCPLC